MGGGKGGSKASSSNPAWLDRAGSDIMDFAKSVFFTSPTTPGSTSSVVTSPTTSANKLPTNNSQIDWLGNNFSLKNYNNPSGNISTSVTGSPTMSLGNLRGLEQYGGERVAGLSDLEKQARNSALAVIGANRGDFMSARGDLDSSVSGINRSYGIGMDELGTAKNYLAPSTQQFGMGAVQQYMNPFLLSSIMPAVDDARQNAEREALKRQGSFASRSAFGSSRLALEDALAKKNSEDAISKIITSGLATGWDKAQTAFSDDMNRLQSAASIQKGIADSGFNYGSTQSNILQNAANARVNLAKTNQDIADRNIARLAAFGKEDRAIDQAGKDVAYANFIEQRDYPRTVLQELSSIINGNVTKGSVQPGQPGGSTIGGLLGAGASAAAIYSMLSDEKLKDNRVLVRRENGHNIYWFQYNGDDAVYEGVLADEVEKIDPDAVIDIDGFKRVIYNKIGVEPRRIA